MSDHSAWHSSYDTEYHTWYGGSATARRSRFNRRHFGFSEEFDADDTASIVKLVKDDDLPRGWVDTWKAMRNRAARERGQKLIKDSRNKWSRSYALLRIAVTSFFLAVGILTTPFILGLTIPGFIDATSWLPIFILFAIIALYRMWFYAYHMHALLSGALRKGAHVRD